MDRGGKEKQRVGEKERARKREREGTSGAPRNKCRPPDLGSGCRRADRLSRFHGRSFALLTAGRDKQTRTPPLRPYLANTHRRRGKGREEERAEENAVTRARTRVNACLRVDTSSFMRLRGTLWLSKWLIPLWFPYLVPCLLSAVERSFVELDEENDSCR